MDKNLICVGGVTLDRKLKAYQSLHLKTSNPVTSHSTFGGVAYNVAKNLSQLTEDVHLYSVIGDDSEGQSIIDNLGHSNIAAKNILTLPNHSTARYDALLDKDGELYLALADMDIFEHVPLEEFTKSWDNWHENDIVFLDTNLPQQVIQYAIALCHRKNIKLCIDPVSIPKAKKIPKYLDHIFMLKPDRFEAEVLTDRPIHSLSDCFEAGKILLDKGVKQCVITLGKWGSVLVNEQIQQHIPAYSVTRIVDVSGAGDAFIAGILYALKYELSMGDACSIGAAMSSLTIQSSATVNEQITLNAIKQFQLHSTREKNHETVF
jgi:pseudouridine kinase